VPPGLRLAYWLGDLLVFRKFRARFGGRLRFFVSGGAPLNPEICAFFIASGLPIYEGYGLTETSPVITVNRPGGIKPGTVGPPLDDIEIRIAEDGEILTRGPHVMKGYYQNAAATAEVIDPDGWFHTGDIGLIDNDGYLKITDRKKDLIKTSGGKYVAPQDLEGRLKTRSPLLSQVLVHGNNRNFCTALLTVDAEELQRWAEGRGLAGVPYAELSQHPDLRATLQAAITGLNQELASYESIKAFAVLPADFTVEGGELTPSLKMKRKAIEAQHKALLDGFYAGALQDV
jgi:long-chain acyl-CoA synthetase